MDEVCYFRHLAKTQNNTRRMESMNQAQQNHSDYGASFAPNIPKYFAYSILRGLSFGLIIATWVIYLQRQHGLSLTQVTLIDVAFWLASTLGELPTGIVADSYGRKLSLAIGTAIMAASIIGWSFAPTVALITLAYVCLAIGVTFLSGAEDALFFESLKLTGRTGDYTRLIGSISAARIAASAIGNLASGFLATLDLRLPFLAAGLCLIVIFGVVLTFREPRDEELQGEESQSGELPAQEPAHHQAATTASRTTYWDILKQAATLLRERPALRYALLYLTLIPTAGVIVETVFLQPQALVLGIPLAGIGAVVMTIQFVNIAGSTASHRAQKRLGEAWVINVTPLLIALSLVLLGLWQLPPTLIFVAAISFFTAILRPIIMSRIQHQVSDRIRATVLSLQSLMFALFIAVIEPLLGYIADHAGLPAAYFVLAAGLTLLILWLLWKGRPHFA
jgi:MFS family permease